MFFTKCMNYEGAFLTPKGITKNSYKPQCVQKDVLRTSSVCINILHYPNCKSILLDTWEPLRRSIISFDNIRGYQF